MKKLVLVTGGHGFLGSWVCDELRSRNIYAPIPVHSSEGDLRSEHQTDRIFRQWKPWAVIHCAARVGGIGANAQHAGEFFLDNIRMGVNVIEAARKFDVTQTVLIGTACSYPPQPYPWLLENYLGNGYPTGETGAYGEAKRTVMRMAHWYHQHYGLRYACVIPTNLYGPRDNFDDRSSHVIPALIRKCLIDQESVTVWGSPDTTRDFLYVSDAARGIVDAMEKLHLAEPVNLGSGKEVRMESLIKDIQEATNSKAEVKWESSAPIGARRRVMDCFQAQRHLDFEPRVSLPEGLRHTVDWCRQNLKF